MFLFHFCEICFVFTINYSDDLSGILRSEFGLGRSKRDTYLKPWEDVPHRSPMIYNYKIQDGIPAWVKLRVTNHGIFLKNALLELIKPLNFYLK